MSTVIGTAMPPVIVDTLNGEELGEKIGPAYQLITVDEDGTPRPCMLSIGELLATSAQHLRLAVWHGSQTAQNLQRQAKTLLCWVDRSAVIYIYGRIQPLQADSTSLECFELEVERALSDEHAGLPIVEGLRFEAQGTSPSDLVKNWEAQLNVLRTARRHEA